MTQLQWTDIIHAYKQGKTSYFDHAVAKVFQTDYRRQLLIWTQSEEDAWDVFVEAMLKFREKYLLGDCPLPKNIGAFLYQMQRNAWADLCRKRNAKRQIQYKSLEMSKIKETLMSKNMKTTQDLETEQRHQEQHLKALEKAVGHLCEKCKSLLERHVFEGEKLKVLKTELGYTGSYQTIVEKKRRCIKKLTKLFFIELSQIEKV